MSPLFVDTSIVINVPAVNVWDALTKPEFTDQWTNAFMNGEPFHLESAWILNSPVLWKGKDGNVIVEGTMTKIEPLKFLRFTVSDVRSEKSLMNE